ncbi:MAG: galactokinase [Bacteroidales bacterium]|nr:galactokinase [Bacteroidales bacterium]
MDTLELINGFRKFFGEGGQPCHLYFAPGRVNLIGEHTDYNGGYVLPVSIHLGTYLAVRISGRDEFALRSLQFKDGGALTRPGIRNKTISGWMTYPAGILNEFFDCGVDIPGIEMLFGGNIPLGSGLSSSASIEMVTAFALNELLGLKWPATKLIMLAQHAENHYVGMNCGIMDQFAVAMGSPERAIFLNCSTLEYESVPADMGDAVLIVTDSRKSRSLTQSAYNARRSECENALMHLRKGKPADNLSGYTTVEFERLKHLIPNETLLRRARHVITENDRVFRCVEALRNGSQNRFGELMYESHVSLRDDYEVSCDELDILVEESMDCPGVFGSRMTGAGFGGCTVTLVMRDQAPAFMTKLRNHYFRRAGLEPGFYPVDSSRRLEKLAVVPSCR